MGFTFYFRMFWGLSNPNVVTFRNVERQVRAPRNRSAKWNRARRAATAFRLHARGAARFARGRWETTARPLSAGGDARGARVPHPVLSGHAASFTPR